MRIILAVFLLLLLPATSEPIPKSWNGLWIAPEYRCSPYNRGDYSYPYRVEQAIIKRLGGIYEPYTGKYHNKPTDTDIEHIVSLSEAHDSGLCSAEPETRRRFAQDLDNLTLATPEVNRCGEYGKCGKDITEWAPDENICWFADRIITVKRKYSLTIDPREYKILWAISTDCTSNKLLYPEDIQEMNELVCENNCRE